MSVLHRKVWREFRHLRGQVLAIALVMIGGIATMVMSLSNLYVLQDTRAAFYRDQRFAEVFAQVRRAPQSLLESVQAIPGVRDVQARVVSGVMMEVEGVDDAITGQMVSLPSDNPACMTGPARPACPEVALNTLFLREGRLPEPGRRDEVVVSEAFAQAHALRPGDERLSVILNGRLQPLRVVGIGLSPEFIYQIRPGEVFPDFARYGVLWMDRTALAAAFDLDGAFNDLVLTLYRGAVEADVIDRLDDLLAPYGGVGAHGRDLQVSHRFLSEELDQLRVMTRLFTVIFLGVSAFLLNVVVGRLIATQREQVAVLKAFGYTRWEVAWHYAQLVLLMVGVGIVPGLALGAWMGHGLAQVYMDFYRFPYLLWTLHLDVMAMAVLFSLGAAALGAAGALLRAMRLAPAEAMRPEAPPTYRRALSERVGLGPLLGPASRMVLRTLERRPWRTLLSVVGIGLGCGILVMSRFQSGAIEEMIAVQFGFAQREDLAVQFAEAASPRATDELASLPGVQRVEPFRHVGVTLRHGHREYRTLLQGLPADGRLRRVLDDRLRPAPVPAEGLLLTDYLAQWLGVRPGDALEVTLLGGDRRVLRIPVQGTVKEYLGVGAYLDQRHLNALLQEASGVVSGAWLALEPGARSEVIQALRERPRVAAVTDRGATIQGFRDTMAQSILAFTLVATLMAGSIAVGVVYNNARLALSERGRDLASLRVLGYTRAEVRAMLLGELMALTLLALLPGFALGVGMCALLVWGFQSDLYRIPLVINPDGLAFAALVTLAATVLSAALVRRRLDRLDLVAVLKTKE